MFKILFSFFSFNFTCPVSRHFNIQSDQVTAYLFLQSPLDNGYCFEVGLYKVLICSQCIQNSTWPKFGEADSSTAAERCGDEVRSRTLFNHIKERKKNSQFKCTLGLEYFHHITLPPDSPLAL